MKQASGAAYLTVITIVLIGLVAAAGIILIQNRSESMKANSCCIENDGIMEKGVCKGGKFSGYTIKNLKTIQDCK